MIVRACVSPSGNWRNWIGGLLSKVLNCVDLLGTFDEEGVLQRAGVIAMALGHKKGAN